MADKLVVGADGVATTVPLSDADLAQQTIDDANFSSASVAAAEEKTRTDTFRTDADRVDVLNRLKTATAAQIRQYVNNNVTDLASAKLMLARILILISLDARN